MTKRIDARQLVALLMVSRIFAVLTFTPQGNSSEEGTVAMLGALLAVPFYLLLLLPIRRLLWDNPGCGLLEAAQSASPLWGKAVAVLVGAVALMMAVHTAVNFQYFLTTVVYPDHSSVVFLLCFCLVCVYGAYLGLEPLARFSLPVAVGVGLVLLLMVALLTGDLHTAYLHTPLEHGWGPAWRLALSGVAGNLELLVLACLAPATRRTPGAIFGWSLALSLIYVEVVLFYSVGTLGAFGRSQAFPIYAMMASAEAVVLQRLDALHIALWIFVAFLKSSLYLYLAQRAFGMLATDRRRSAGLQLGTGAALLAGCLIFSHRMTWFAGMMAFLQSGIPALCTTVSLPVLTLAIQTIRKKKEVTAQ